MRQQVQTDGTILNEINYDSFGNIVSETNPTAGDRFKFTGREYDDLIGLYYYRARWYDAGTGKFLSEDPLGFAAGDYNLSRYVFNDPISYRDPSGKFAAVAAPAAPIVFLPIVGQVILVGFAVGVTVWAGYHLYSSYSTNYAPPAAPVNLDPDVYEDYAITPPYPYAPGHIACGAKTPSLEQGYDRLLRSEEAKPKEEGSEYTWEEIQQELKELPKGRGKKRNVRLAPNREKLREMFERWTKGAKPKTPRTYGERDEGYELEDGTWIGWREDSTSGGPAIDLQPPPGCGKQRRIHIPWP